MGLAYAVLRSEPPEVYAAENVDVLHRVIALKIVANTEPRTLPSGAVDRIRAALLEERWGDAVVDWMTYSNLALDVYNDGLDVFTEAHIPADTVGLEIQLAPLFTA